MRVIFPAGQPSCLCHACASLVWRSQAALIKHILTPAIIYATCTLSLIDICLAMYKISTENAVALVPFVSVSVTCHHTCWAISFFMYNRISCKLTCQRNSISWVLLVYIAYLLREPIGSLFFFLRYNQVILKVQKCSWVFPVPARLSFSASSCLPPPTWTQSPATHPLRKPRKFLRIILCFVATR